jgi:hypothetical protein
MSSTSKDEGGKEDKHVACCACDEDLWGVHCDDLEEI